MLTVLYVECVMRLYNPRICGYPEAKRGGGDKCKQVGYVYNIPWLVGVYAIYVYDLASRSEEVYVKARSAKGYMT